jgi:hypothetical protein
MKVGGDVRLGNRRAGKEAGAGVGMNLPAETIAKVVTSDMCLHSFNGMLKDESHFVAIYGIHTQRHEYTRSLLHQGGNWRCKEFAVLLVMQEHRTAIILCSYSVFKFLDGTSFALNQPSGQATKRLPRQAGLRTTLEAKSCSSDSILHAFQVELEGLEHICLQFAPSLVSNLLRQVLKLGALG